MSDFIRQLSQLSTVRWSASGVVTVTLSTRSGLRIALNHKRLHTTDEDTLAEEIEQTLFAARDAHAADRKRIAEANPPKQPVDLRERILELRKTVRAHLESVEVTVLSARRLVEVTAYGDGDLAIRFLDNAVRRTDVRPAMLEAELNDAVVKADGALNQAARDVVARPAAT